MSLNWTFIGQSLTFFVFVWACWKFIWPPLISAMRERQQAIADGLSHAERAAKDLQLAQERATDQMRGAKEEAAALLEQARGRAIALIEEAKNVARDEGERIKEAARAEIDQEVNRAKEVLRTQVAALAVNGAERILGASVDTAAHSRMLEELAAEL
jgi:F-type H+-transporting ATPase subunit b